METLKFHFFRSVTFIKFNGNQFLYFLLAVVFLGSMGIWLPLAIDYFPSNKLSKNIIASIPNNLLTYYLSVFFISLIDRIRYMINDQRYKHKETEILISAIVVIICIYLTYCSFSLNYQKKYDEATQYGIYATCLSLIVWWIANAKQPKTNQIDSLGGNV